MARSCVQGPKFNPVLLIYFYNTRGKEIKMARFTLEEANAVKRLLPYADRKGFIADLILNGYDSRH
jgi:hypothetical protein